MPKDELDEILGADFYKRMNGKMPDRLIVDAYAKTGLYKSYKDVKSELLNWHSQELEKAVLEAKINHQIKIYQELSQANLTNTRLTDIFDENLNELQSSHKATEEGDLK